MYTELRHEAERYEDDIVGFTQDLVRCPSPSLHESVIAARVESRMRDLEYDLVFRDDIGNVVGLIEGGDPGNALLMNCHMDTVRPEPIDAWRPPPFSGDIVRDRVCGIGSADCKGGLASQIFAGHLLATSRLGLRRSIVVAGTVAEENGCSVGVRHLIKHTLPTIGVVPRFAVLGEPTNLKIGIGHDGWMLVDIDVSGRNPDFCRFVAAQLSKMLDLMCDGYGPAGGPSIMTVDAPREELAPNGLHIKIGVRRRLLPRDSSEQVIRWLEEEVVRDLRDLQSVTVAVHVHEEEQRFEDGHTEIVRAMNSPWSTGLLHPMVERGRETLLAAGLGWNGERWCLDHLGMGTAGSVLTRDFGIPTIGFGPGEEEQAHAVNESLGIARLIKAVYGSAVLIHGLIGAPLKGWN